MLSGLALGSSVSLRGLARMGNRLSVFGRVASGSSLSILSEASFGSSASLGAFFRIGSSVSLTGFVRLGERISVVERVSFGSSLSICFTLLRFGPWRRCVTHFDSSRSILRRSRADKRALFDSVYLLSFELMAEKWGALDFVYHNALV